MMSSSAPVPHLERSKTPDVRNRSFEIRARLERTSGQDGVLVASGARTGGYTLFVQDDHLVYTYNHLGRCTDVVSDEVLPEGLQEVVVRYTKTGEHQGTARLLVGDGEGSEREIGSGSVETLPYRQTMYGMDIGRDLGPTVSPRYGGPFTFAGALHHVDFALEDDRADLVKAAEVELENQLADQ